MSTLEDRLAEEIERAGGIIKVSTAISVDRNTIRNWINNGTVTSKRLQELAEGVGIDLSYVVLGMRAPKEPQRSGITLHEVVEEVLTPDEAELLVNYRLSGDDGKSAIRATCAAFAQSARVVKRGEAA